MSRVTLPDVAKHLASILLNDATLQAKFTGGTVKLYQIVPEPVPPECVFYHLSNLPTQLPGKRNAFDTTMVDLHIISTRNEVHAAQIYSIVYGLVEKPSMATPGTIVTSLDGVTETYVSVFNIEGSESYVDQRNGVPIFGYQMTLRAIAHNWV